MWQGKSLVAKAGVLLSALGSLAGTASAACVSCAKVRKDVKLPEGQPDLGFQWRRRVPELQG